MSGAPFRSMAPGDRARVEDLCRRCKTGYRPTPEEQSYLERVFLTHPEDYRAIDERTRRWATRLMNPLAPREGEE